MMADLALIQVYTDGLVFDWSNTALQMATDTRLDDADRLTCFTNARRRLAAVYRYRMEP